MSAGPSGAPVQGVRACAAAVLLLFPLTAPGATADAAEPAVPAEAAIVVDAASGDVIAAENPTERRAIASATKLMTALLTLEGAKLGDVFTAADYDPAPVESQIGLTEGERMTVRDLLVALLLESANDAAVTLAEGVAGSTEEFVAAMNARARELGLDDTSYANPIGFDAAANYSTAADLAQLARRLMEDERFRNIVEEPSIELRSGRRPRVVENRNDLVDTELVDGIKTGSTTAAGEVLVGSGSQGGVRVISVVLGAPTEAARDEATLELLDYGLEQFERRRVVAAGEPLGSASVAGDEDESVPLVAADDLSLVLLRDQRVRTRARAPGELEGPLDAGEVVGSAAVVRDGRILGRVDLAAGRAVPSPGLFTSIGITLAEDAVALAVLAVALIGLVATVAARLRRRGAEPTA